LTAPVLRLTLEGESGHLKAAHGETTRMKCFGLAMLVAMAAAPTIAATCAPPTLTRIVTRSVGPDIQLGSFRAQPMTLYRKGELYLRNEEAPDPDQRVHALTIVSEPDIWMVNRVDMTGRHVVDPGPIFVAHAPIVAGQGVPAAFMELEFGCEAAFAMGRGREAGVRMVADKSARIYALQVGDRRLEILLTDRGTPAEVAYYQGARTVLTIRYDAYETGLPDDPTLFQKPAGVTFQPEGPR
jgi:hypothetical protein